MGNLSNLKPLIEDLENQEWTLACFKFNYKNTPYAAIVKRFLENDRKNDKYALARIEIVDLDSVNLSRRLSCEVNSNKLLADAKTIREFFKINYSNNLGDVLNQLYNHINKYIPTKVPKNYSEIEKILVVESLSRSDSEDPTKIYPLNLKRNGKGRSRSPFNSDKTKIICPEVFDLIKDDPSISCCFTSDENKGKPSREIIDNFSMQI